MYNKMLMNYKQSIIQSELEMNKETLNGDFDNKFKNIDRVAVVWRQKEDKPKDSLEWATLTSSFNLENLGEGDIRSHLKNALKSINEKINDKVSSDGSVLIYWLPMQNLREVTTRQSWYNHIRCPYTNMKYAVHVFDDEDGTRRFVLSVDVLVIN
jgi:hypothetical protein